MLKLKSHLYDQSLSLLTDLYQLTMSYAYWKTGLDKHEAVFHLFFRRPPFHGGFTVSAGLESAINYLNQFSFKSSDLEYLATLRDSKDQPLFEQAFLDYLGDLKFSCSVDAMPEGTVAFPYEPMVRVQGPLIQAQLIESPLLNQINFPSLIATKAARMCIASKGDPVIEFGLRRAQGIDGALTASRAAYIGGCTSTSNTLAGKLFGIPVGGTHSHSWVMAFDDELESFKAYAQCLPNNCVFLVDTFNSLEGVRRAIEVGKWLRSQGKELLGVRLDSGDLAQLSINIREMLNEAGFPDAKIIASNELDEVLISELKRQGAQINVWGVGTHLVTGKEQPALDGVYKLSAIRDPGGSWKDKLKLSEQMVKISNPGILQVRRYYDDKGYTADAIYDIRTNLDQQDCEVIDPIDSTKSRILKLQQKHKDLLVPIFRDGRCVYDMPSLIDIRTHVQRELSQFNVGIKRFFNPHQYFVGMEKTLYDLKIALIREIRSHIQE